ncbi:unnamed protein product [Allacma fusca]|uniref:Protein kinase domain-containing protein n=1 Tax=Allacma fusca TaxID=39272 RepID=A0A8J2LEG4_9HEXA|nr:unnamed protein product [Allacma fusca]
MDEYENLLSVGIVGRGAFGVIYKALDQSGKQYAIKRQPFDANTFNFLETDIHFRGDPKYVAKGYFMGKFQDNFYIVQDLYCGDLTKLPPDAPLKAVAYISHQMARSIDYLHGNNIIHKDIKPANFFLTCDYQVKLSDFGFSINAGGPNVASGTPIYMSIDALHGNASAASDWYAFGLCIWYILTGIHLQQVDTMDELYALLQYNLVQIRLQGLRKAGYRHYISMFVKREPQQRLTYRNSCQHMPESMKATQNWDHATFINNVGIQILPFGDVEAIEPERTLNKPFEMDQYFRSSAVNAANFRERNHGRFVREGKIPMHHPSPKRKISRDLEPVEGPVYNLRRRNNN